MKEKQTAWSWESIFSNAWHQRFTVVTSSSVQQQIVTRGILGSSVVAMEEGLACAASRRFAVGRCRSLRLRSVEAVGMLALAGTQISSLSLFPELVGMRLCQERRAMARCPLWLRHGALDRWVDGRLVAALPDRLPEAHN